MRTGCVTASIELAVMITKSMRSNDALINIIFFTSMHAQCALVILYLQ
jgi:hypothetical protein